MRAITNHYGSVLFLGWMTSFATVFPSVIYPAHIYRYADGCRHDCGADHGTFLCTAGAAAAAPRKSPETQYAGGTHEPQLSTCRACLPIFRALARGAAPAFYGSGVGAVEPLGSYFPVSRRSWPMRVAAKFIRPHETGARLALAIGLLIVAWVLAGFTAEVIASI